MQVLAQMGWSQWFLAAVIIVVCCFLMLVILVQRGRGGGLSGAFGGMGGSSAFGAKTGDVFTWITVVVAAIFLLLASVGNFVLDRSPEARATAPSDTAESAETTEPASEPPASDQGPPPPRPITDDVTGESTAPSDAAGAGVGDTSGAGVDEVPADTEVTDVPEEETSSDVTDQPTAAMPEDVAGEGFTPVEGGGEDQPSP